MAGTDGTGSGAYPSISPTSPREDTWSPQPQAGPAPQRLASPTNRTGPLRWRETFPSSSARPRPSTTSATSTSRAGPSLPPTSRTASERQAQARDPARRQDQGAADRRRGQRRLRHPRAHPAPSRRQPAGGPGSGPSGRLQVPPLAHRPALPLPRAGAPPRPTHPAGSRRPWRCARRHEPGRPDLLPDRTVPSARVVCPGPFPQRRPCPQAGRPRPHSPWRRRPRPHIIRSRPPRSPPLTPRPSLPCPPHLTRAPARAAAAARRCALWC